MGEYDQPGHRWMASHILVIIGSGYGLLADGTKSVPESKEDMMTSSSGNIFRVTGHLCGEFTGPRWLPRTKASDAELWCFLWSASE